MTGSSVQIGGVLFGGAPDLAGGVAEAQKKGQGKPVKVSSGKDGIKEARASFLGRIFGGQNRQKGKAEDRSTGASSRVSEAPAEFVPVPCPPEPCELDSPVISPRPEASGEEESRSLRERLRAAETHRGPGPAGPIHTAGPGPIHTFESYVIESLTRKQRRPALDLAALAAASANGGDVEPAERDTWQGGAEPEGPGDEGRSGEAAGFPKSPENLEESRTGEGSDATSIRSDGSEDGEDSLRNRGGANVGILVYGRKPVESGELLDRGTSCGAEVSEDSASGEEESAGSRPGDVQGLEVLRGGDWLAATRSPDERASGRLKEFDYERRASAERGVGETDRKTDTWPASGVPGGVGKGRTEESEQVSEKAAGPSYAQELGQGESRDSQFGTLPEPPGVEGDEGRSGNTDEGRRNGETARGGIEWWPIKGAGTGRSDVASVGVEPLQPPGSQRKQHRGSPAGLIEVQGVGESGVYNEERFGTNYQRKSLSEVSHA